MRRSHRVHEKEDAGSISFPIRFHRPATVILSGRYFQICPTTGRTEIENDDDDPSLSVTLLPSRPIPYHHIEGIDQSTLEVVFETDSKSGEKDQGKTEYVDFLSIVLHDPSTSPSSFDDEDYCSAAISEGMSAITPRQVVLFFVRNGDVEECIQQFVGRMQSHCQLKLEEDQSMLEKLQLRQAEARQTLDRATEEIRVLEERAPEMFGKEPGLESWGEEQESGPMVRFSFPVLGSEQEQTKIDDNPSNGLESMLESLQMAIRQVDELLHEEEQKKEPRCVEIARERVTELTEGILRPMCARNREVAECMKLIERNEVRMDELKGEIQSMYEEEG